MTHDGGAVRPDPRVAVCEGAQAAWLRSRAVVAGGAVWRDGPLPWVWNPATREGALLFPVVVDPDRVAAGLARLRALGAATVGAWLPVGVEGDPLDAHGFERGWSPWWMWADLPLGPVRQDARVHVDHVVPAAFLDSTRRAWHAVAAVDGRHAGGAWLHRVDDVAGLFDMGVDPRWERRGLGSALLGLLCDVAYRDGARTVVLNATPAGAELYGRRGFVRVGDGATWWWHR